MSRSDFWVHAVVDSVVILGHISDFPRNGGRVLTADDHMRRSALVKGLGRLSAHFGDSKPDRRQGTPAAPSGAAAPPRTVRGLPVMFSPETDDRPEAADVTEAVTRLRGTRNV
jgi:hypothetical protein